MSDEKSSYRTQIVIAVIGLVGVLGSALIASWDKVFPAQQLALGTATPTAAPAALPTRAIPTPALQTQAPTEAAAPPTVASFNGEQANFFDPAPLPQNSCAEVAGMFWMQWPNTWYGPFEGYALAWDAVGGFYVWDPIFGQLQFPDPYAQIQRNTWFRLPNTRFNICVDMLAGNVLGQYSP